METQGQKTWKIRPSSIIPNDILKGRKCSFDEVWVHGEMFPKLPDYFFHQDQLGWKRSYLRHRWKCRNKTSGLKKTLQATAELHFVANTLK